MQKNVKKIVNTDYLIENKLKNKKNLYTLSCIIEAAELSIKVSLDNRRKEKNMKTLKLLNNNLMR
jgi:hypothetical protein